MYFVVLGALRKMQLSSFIVELAFQNVCVLLQ